MPVTARKIGTKYRVCERGTQRVTRNAYGTPVDGGGYHSRRRALQQVAAINRRTR